MDPRLHVIADGSTSRRSDKILPLQGIGMRSDATMEGNTTGFYVFAPKPGRMLARRRTGKIAGDVNIPAAGMTMKQAIDYTNTVDLVK